MGLFIYIQAFMLKAVYNNLQSRLNIIYNIKIY